MGLRKLVIGKLVIASSVVDIGGRDVSDVGLDVDIDLRIGQGASQRQCWVLGWSCGGMSEIGTESLTSPVVAVRTPGVTLRSLWTWMPPSWRVVHELEGWSRSDRWSI